MIRYFKGRNDGTVYKVDEATYLVTYAQCLEAGDNHFWVKLISQYWHPADVRWLVSLEEVTADEFNEQLAKCIAFMTQKLNENTK